MASKDKIFLDTDVALDHLADGQPFVEYAHRILALAETGELAICVSSLSFNNLYYPRPGDSPWHFFGVFWAWLPLVLCLMLLI